MSLSRLAPLLFLVPSVALAQRQAASAPSAPSSATGPAAARLPLKHAPRPTSPAITAADLMTRLYIFADDSMLGRQAGTENNLRGTAYIAAELRKLGLTPAGDSGTFFQNVPLVRRAFAESATIAVGGETLAIGTDFLPATRRGSPRSLAGAQVIYGGRWGDSATTLSREQVAGRLVLFVTGEGNGPQVAATRLRPDAPLAAAAGIAVVGLERLSPAAVAFYRQPTLGMSVAAASAATVPLGVVVSRRAADVLLGKSLDSARSGDMGRTVAGTPATVESVAPARNVVAVLRGSDRALRGEYVAIGAHNDHLGFNHAPVDHDSLKAFNAAAWEMAGKYAGLPPLSAAQRASIVVPLDSLRRADGPARLDSISNGADDDGSGTVAVLEIAEAMARAKHKPRRSVLFVWHTGEELGLLGSRWFTDHPTVPRDSIVAQVNIDMIGRGSAADTRGGGPDYLGLVGSRRLSTELGDLVEVTNRAERRPLAFDYALDANGHPENIYCRSDHYNYARFGIPIVFFFTGLHGDYHQVTDEPQYIDYPHMERIARFVGDVTTRIANLDHRPVVDKEKPDPNGGCRQ